MSPLPKSLSDVKGLAQKSMESIDVDKLKSQAFKAGDELREKAGDIKEVAVATKDDIEDKLTELDRMLEESITAYNDAYTLMNDKGIRLFVERSRAIDSIANVETLINSIANTPKSFATDFEEIQLNRNKFTDSCEFAEKELIAAREAAGGAGAGLAAGATVAFMGPATAMWIATTFGTASTGAAISTLSGAAATNAALAWLGGGALAAGGSGVAGGTAFLALAGPIGWTIAGASLLTTIVLFTSKKTKINKQKNEEIETVKMNTKTIKEMDSKLNSLLTQTSDVRELLGKSFNDCLGLFGSDYSSLSDEDKMKLGALVNNTKSLSVLFDKNIGEEEIVDVE